MSISFPYETKQIDEDTLVDPRVTLDVKTTRGFLSIKFLVDSGADVTTLPIDPYRELFDFQRDSSKRITIGGIEGRGVAAYPHLLTVRFRQDEFPLRSYFIMSSTIPLLGRLDVWRMFSITFDNKRMRTVFSPLKRIG